MSLWPLRPLFKLTALRKTRHVLRVSTCRTVQTAAMPWWFKTHTLAGHDHSFEGGGSSWAVATILHMSRRLRCHTIGVTPTRLADLIQTPIFLLFVLCCAAGQCCGGVILGKKCVGIGCTCFCPATNGNFKCMIAATKYLTSRKKELAKCGKNGARSANLAKSCSTGDIGACTRLAKQVTGR